MSSYDGFNGHLVISSNVQRTFSDVFLENRNEEKSLATEDTPLDQQSN